MPWQDTEAGAFRFSSSAIARNYCPIFDFGMQALSTRFPAENEPDAKVLPFNLVQYQNKNLI